MFFKLIAVGMIIVFSTWVGVDKCRFYDKKIKKLENIIKFLKFLKSEIAFNNRSVINIFEDMSNYKFYDLNNVMDSTSQMVKDGYHSLYEAWSVSVTNNDDLSKYLNDDEIRYLVDFGKQLGVCDLQTEISNINNYIEKFKELYDFYLSQRKDKHKLYKTIGVTSGAVVSLVLI